MFAINSTLQNRATKRCAVCGSAYVRSVRPSFRNGMQDTAHEYIHISYEITTGNRHQHPYVDTVLI